MDVVSHFRLRRAPFAPAADIWSAGPVAIALPALAARIAAGERWLALVGPAGTGRSLTLALLAARLREGGREIATIAHPVQMPRALPIGSAILVDEADGFGLLALALLRDAARAGLVVVLAGDGRFVSALGDDAPLRPTRLAPLTGSESRAFISDRLAAAGGADLFGRDAVDAVVAAGGGRPRRIGVVAAGAMIEAALSGAPRVAALHVEDALAMQAGLGRAPSSAQPVPAPAIPAEPARTPLIRRQEGALAASLALVLALIAVPALLPAFERQAPSPAPAQAVAAPAAPRAAAAPVQTASRPSAAPPAATPVAAAAEPEATVSAAPLRGPALSPGSPVRRAPPSPVEPAPLPADAPVALADAAVAMPDPPIELASIGQESFELRADTRLLRDTAREARETMQMIR